MDEAPALVAQSLYHEILDSARCGSMLSGDGGLSESVVDEIDAYFLSDAVFSEKGRAARDGREKSEYWRDHGRITGKLMKKMAQNWGGNAFLYERTGIIHDADYLKYPHDHGPCATPHPVALVNFLREREVHPVICLAILEHAPSQAFFYILHQDFPSRSQLQRIFPPSRH